MYNFKKFNRTPNYDFDFASLFLSAADSDSQVLSTRSTSVNIPPTHLTQLQLLGLVRGHEFKVSDEVLHQVVTVPVVLDVLEQCCRCHGRKSPDHRVPPVLSPQPQSAASAIEHRSYSDTRSVKQGTKVWVIELVTHNGDHVSTFRLLETSFVLKE